MRWLSHFRAQFSRDRQQSYTNSSDVLIKIPTILDASGRSSVLPRETREHRVHLADTVSVEGPRHALKFGGDALITKIFDFFPNQQSGEYLFHPIKVNPFTFEPQMGALQLTPLRAYAHQVARPIAGVTSVSAGSVQPIGAQLGRQPRPASGTTGRNRGDH